MTLKTKSCGNSNGCENTATKAVEVDVANYRYFTCDDCLPPLLMAIGLEHYLADPRIVEL